MASGKDGAILAGEEQRKSQRGPWEEWGCREETGRHGLACGSGEGLGGNTGEP